MIIVLVIFLPAYVLWDAFDEVFYEFYAPSDCTAGVIVGHSRVVFVIGVDGVKVPVCSDGAGTALRKTIP